MSRYGTDDLPEMTTQAFDPAARVQYPMAEHVGDTPIVWHVLERLDRAIEGVAARAQAVQHKIEPVLSPERGEDAKLLDANPHVGALASRLFDACNRLELIDQSLHETVERIEL